MNKAYEYAKHCLKSKDVPRYVKKQARVFIKVADGKDEKYFLDDNKVKQVINTNKCLIHLEKHDDMLLITSCIDNLLKGSSGQAVHNMNLLFNLEETTGLNLKATAY